MAQVMSKAKTAQGAKASATAASEKASASKTTTQARKARSSGTTKAKAAKAKSATAERGATDAKSPAPAKRAAPAKKAATGAATSRSKSTAAKKPAAKAAASPKSAAPANGTLSKAHARLSRKMLDEREKLVRQAEELEAEQAALAADPDAAEMSGDVESGDCVASREREVDLRLSAHIEDMIAQIDRATERLNAGTYGECARCHSRIPAARLEALPYAELCVSCQEKHERLYY